MLVLISSWLCNLTCPRMLNVKRKEIRKFKIQYSWYLIFSPQLFFYTAYFIFFLQSVRGTIIGSYQEFSESGNGNMIEGLLKNKIVLFFIVCGRLQQKGDDMTKIWTNPDIFEKYIIKDRLKGPRPWSSTI
jgi:hypothetical protein